MNALQQVNNNNLPTNPYVHASVRQEVTTNNKVIYSLSVYQVPPNAENTPELIIKKLKSLHRSYKKYKTKFNHVINNDKLSYTHHTKPRSKSGLIQIMDEVRFVDISKITTTPEDITQQQLDYILKYTGEYFHSYASAYHPDKFYKHNIEDKAFILKQARQINNYVKYTNEHGTHTDNNIFKVVTLLA